MSSPDQPVTLGPLHDLHEASGANMVPFAGWLMPLRFGSDIAEHTAVRTAAGLFDLSHMGEITVSGPDAGVALNGALVGNLDALALGRAKYTMMCADDGGVIDDLIVYRTGEQDFLVIANASNAETVFGELKQRTAGSEVTVSDVTSDYALLAVQGPHALEIVNSLVAKEDQPRVTEQPYYSIINATMNGAEVSLARTGYTGEDGFEVLCKSADGSGMWAAILEVGQAFGIVPAGLAARDTLRLEAGMPLYGHELSAALTPYDAGLGRVVRLDKEEDFVGRTALTASSLATQAQTLVGLVGQGRRPARAESTIVNESGEVIGILTSGGPSPTLGKPIAMAYLDSDHADVGAVVSVDIRGRTEPFEVVKLPFYRRPKEQAAELRDQTRGTS